MFARRRDLEHPWQVDRGTAARIQSRLAVEVIARPVPATGAGAPTLAAGVDVGYTKDGSRAWAAAVVMDRHFRVLETRVVAGTPDGPYAPGYLAFREGRLTIEALLGLSNEPELVFLDGHGVVHERGLGLASHVGVLLGVPTVGVPKTPFHAIDHMPGPERGDFYVLTKEWGAQGASVRLKSHTKPVYVSPGHLVDLESALALALAWSSGRHRVPDPLAAAHTLSAHARNEGAAHHDTEPDCSMVGLPDGKEYVTPKIRTDRKGATMEPTEQVLEAMKSAGEPVSAGKVAEMTGLDRKVVDKAFDALKKSGAIESPVRCKWQPKG